MNINFDKRANEVAYNAEPARYSKGNFLVRFAKDGTGLKGRGERLIDDGLNCRYTGRESGYIVSPSKFKRFEELLADGWDACVMTGQLCGPAGERVPNRSKRSYWAI